jgi:membrane protein implicated in regulation of membrane protease activity
MAWWVWVLVGLGLLGVEVLTPGGFFVLFFGLGALAVGVLVGLGAGGPAWLQLLLFSLLSTVTLVLFGRRMMEWMQYVARFGELAKAGNTLVLPANLTDVGSMIALAMSVIRRQA